MKKLTTFKIPESKESPAEDKPMLTTLLLSAIFGAALLALLYKPTNSKKGHKPFKAQNPADLPNYRGVKRVIDPTEVQEVKVGKSGIGSAPPETVTGLLKKCRDRAGDKLALWHADNDGNKRTFTWAQLYKESTDFAKACMAVGLRKSEITNIVGFNMPEWFFAEYGTMLCGAIPAGVYTTSNAGAMAYIASHAKAKIIVVESKKYLQKYVDVKGDIPTVETMVVWAKISDADFDEMANALSGIKLYRWNDFIALGNNVSDAELDARLKDIQPGNIGSLIYTSGTTGNPKAVMCCHDAMCFEARSLIKTIEGSGSRPGFTTKNYSCVSFLPLNHAAAKVLDMLGPIFFTSEYAAKGFHATTYIARPDAMKGTLTQTLAIARPSLFFGVPRVWEKIMEKMLAKGASSPFPLKQLSAYGKTLGKQWYQNTFNDNDGSVPLMWPFFNNTLFAIVRKKLGLDNCELFATGAAPIKPEVLKYFGSIGIPIANAYGMSENMGACSCNLYNNYGFGSAGYALDGFGLKIQHDADRDKPGHGEILIGGRGNMTGYMYDPEKTAGTIDKDGYVHSGDIGMIKNGCLYITGRIKELIIGAGGENIAPVPIEHFISGKRPGISNIVMTGNMQKYNVCLISVKCHVDPDTGIPSSALAGAAKAVDPACKTVEDAMKSEVWHEYLESGIKEYNNNPAVCVSRASKIQKFKILPTDLNVVDGTLGPTLKVKRGTVEKTYKNLIESMYSK